MKILSPATSANLGPGFDSLGLAIKLYNEITITEQSFSQISISGEGENNSGLKKHNSFVNIFNSTLSELGLKGKNFRFDFKNAIPLSRGLGSSSAIIISAIFAAYKIAGFSLSKNKLVDLGLAYEPHPDNIAPCAHGGFCVSILKGNSVITKKATLSGDLRAVVVVPPIKISTAASRSALQASYSRSDCVSNLSHASLMSAAFVSGDYELLRLCGVDKMHEDARMKAVPELFKIREIAYQNGALLSTLSGSGSSFFNLVYKNDAKKLKSLLASEFSSFSVNAYELDNEGAQII